jgi:hypothetical protein
MTLPLNKLLLRFEALGDNCEFGLVQRKAGAEPLGLLRFAGFHIPTERRITRLIDALARRFEGLGAIDTVRIEAVGEAGRREFLVFEDAWDLMYHSFQLEGDVQPETLRRQEAHKLAFLRRKLIADLEAAEKTLVWKSNHRLAEADVTALLDALHAFGPNRLLWVEAADTGHAPATLEPRGDYMVKGYVDRFAPYDRATDISYQSWFDLCGEAHRYVQEAAE